MILFAVTCAIAVIDLVTALFMLLQHRDRHAAQHGFQVNPAGPMPVGLKEREEDHG
jgi:hypothetical protein